LRFGSAIDEVGQLQTVHMPLQIRQERIGNLLLAGAGGIPA